MALDCRRDEWIDEGERAFTRFTRDNPTSPEAISHHAELYERLRETAQRANIGDPNEVGSVEWRMASGIFWGRARTGARIQLVDVASRMGTRPDVIRFAEAGLIRDPELLGGLFEKYAQALEKPDLLNDYVAKLQTPYWQERSGFKMPNYDSLMSEPMVSVKDIKGLAKAVVVGAVVGIGLLAARSVYRRISG